MKKLYFLFIACIVFTIYPGAHIAAQSGVSINSVGAAPDNSAILDVSSTFKGQLMPRMTTAQRDAIVNPAEGLMIYNTDCKTINFNVGTPGAPVWSQVITSTTVNAVASVSIAASPSGMVCTNTGVTFTATPVNGGSSPVYQWQVNGANAGSNDSSFTSIFNNGDVVDCILTSNLPCVSGSPATSNTIVMSVDSSFLHPIVITGPVSVRADSSGITYSIPPIANASGYTWSVPTNVTITSGQGTNSITVSFGSDAGTDTIKVTATNFCGSGTSALAVTVTGGTITFNATNSSGRFGTMQTFVVPVTGTYTIQAYGAQAAAWSGGGQGGLGAKMQGDFVLNSGTVLQIMVGQTGNPGQGGGGGGTFVVDSATATPLIIAGGGGGGGFNGDNGAPGTTGTAGTAGTGGAQGTGGDNGGGGGGAAGYGGGGGGGFCGNGGNAGEDYCGGGVGGNGCVNGTDGNCAVCTNSKGLSFLNGGTGGSGNCYVNQQGDGGFGGGGASIWGNACGGGGGGYSGGGAGGYSGSFGHGGGGGSYNSGTNQSNTSGFQTGNGKVVIAY